MRIIYYNDDKDDKNDNDDKDTKVNSGNDDDYDNSTNMMLAIWVQEQEWWSWYNMI